MAAVCDICGKKPWFGKSVTFSHKRNNRRWDPNVQRVRALVNGTPGRVDAVHELHQGRPRHPDPAAPALVRPSGRRTVDGPQLIDRADPSPSGRACRIASVTKAFPRARRPATWNPERDRPRSLPTACSRSRAYAACRSARHRSTPHRLRRRRGRSRDPTFEMTPLHEDGARAEGQDRGTRPPHVVERAHLEARQAGRLGQVGGHERRQRQQQMPERPRHRRPAAGDRASRRRPGRPRSAGAAFRPPPPQGPRRSRPRPTSRSWLRRPRCPRPRRGSDRRPSWARAPRNRRRPSVFCTVTAVIAVMPKTPRALNVLRSAWMPAPPPESDPAIVSARGRRAWAPTAGPSVIGSDPIPRSGAVVPPPPHQPPRVLPRSRSYLGLR